MRLKRLICRGFKSFADKTELEFHGSLTGIVGPNGCGKSNVVDALKWVLGDQRARSLRGTEMTDVIFKGAQGRDGMHQAEVFVTLEDEGGGLGGRTEVTLGRRLNRDKESEYLINGEPARLKDVRDLLLDTGLGVGAYSVMEQGRIDALLSANALERRAIFEEAAGISRFRVQKKETLRRLERTEQNLARVTDLLDERGRRIRGLKVQAGKARRYRELKAQLRDLRAALAVIEARTIRAEQAAAMDEQAAVAAQLAACDEQRAAVQAQLGELEAAIDVERRALDEAQEQVHRHRAQEEGARHRAAAHRRRGDELDGEQRQAIERRDVLRGQEVERQAALADGRRRLEEMEARLVEYGRELEAARAALRERQEAVREATQERERARNAVLECIHQRTAQRNRAHDDEAQIKAVDMRSTRLRERRELLVAEREDIDRERGGLEAAAAEHGGRAAELRRQEAERIEAMAAADREAAELAQKEADLRAALSEVGGRLRVLRDMESRREGLDSGPRHLLERRPDGLRGSLLDMLQVDLEVGSAMEAALGNFAQALVVDTRAHADAMLRELGEGGFGRALLLVEDEFGAELDERAHPPLPAGSTLLADRVQCEPRARRLLNWLLRGVCLVDSLGQADARRPDLAFVTRQGALLCGPRLEGGSSGGTDAQRGLVVRRAQIVALDEDAARLQGELDALAADRGRAQGRSSELRREVEQLGAALDGARSAEQQARAELSRVSGRQAELDRLAETLELEGHDLAQQRIGALARLSDHLLAVLLVQRRERAAAAREGELAQVFADASAQLHAAQQSEQELRVQQAAMGSDRDGLRQGLRLQEQALEDLSRGCAELDQRAEAARQGAEEARGQAVAEGARADQLVARIAELEQARQAAAARVDAARERLDAARRRAHESEVERARLGEEVTRLRLLASDLEHRFARLDERLRDDVQIELRRVLGEVEGEGLVSHGLEGPWPPVPVDGDAPHAEVLLGPPMPEAMLLPERELQRLWDGEGFEADAAGREIKVLQAQIERLGSVNLDAVRELEEEEGSILFLEKEVGDLREARKGLMSTLARLEEESRRLFESTFEAARANFQGIFRKLFQGGRADMFLTDAADSLEAGIEIVAKPPGKELQSINLLSGGERSLTALAILFSVFKVKPSPFCILDEVDAALDDTNVERFLRVLREFIGPTQFCIVTHHKRTMAACQVLYGITMQKRGVSSRIAVSLEEVDSILGDEEPQPGANRLLPSAERQRIAGEEPVGF